MYGGGGIEPCLAPLKFHPTPFSRGLVGRQEFETYSQKFIAEGDNRIPLPIGRAGWSSSRTSPSTTPWSGFATSSLPITSKIDEAAFQKDLTFIKAMMRLKIDRAAFGIAEARRHMVEVDPQAQAGLASFGEAEKLAGVQRPVQKSR